MSGGSFNYLCDAAGFGQLGERRGAIADMAKALDDYDHPGAAQAAADTRQVLAILESADELAERLSDVWHDVEWHHSSDYGVDQVHEALSAYTAPTPPAPEES